MIKNYAEILSYRPNIRYRSKKATQSVSLNIINIQTVSDFIDNSPINNYQKLNNLVASMQENMNKLQDIFFETRYAGYTFSQYANMVDDNKLSSVNEIYEKAIDDIDSNIVIETYKKLHDEYKDVVEFGKLYRKVNYGKDDISIENAEKVDFDSLERIEKYQYGNNEKINHACLNFESKLNKIVEMKLELSTMYANTLQTMPVAKVGESSSENTNLKTGAKVLFDDVNKEYKEFMREYEDVKSFKRFSILYEFICIKLREYYELLELNSTLFDNAGSLTCNDIEKTISKFAKDIDSYILELYKLVANQSIYDDTYSKILDKKDRIKKYYNN